MYTFKHALVQDTAYEALLKTRRRELHRIVANTLTQHFPELTETQPEILAHHYTEAGLAEQAITYWQRAGTRAAKRAANAEAVSHLRHGLALLEALPARAANAEQEFNILIALGPALMTTISSAAPDVQHVYTRARQLAQETGKVAQLFVSIWGSWLAAFTSGDREAFPKFADELFAIAHSQSDAGFLLQSYHAAWPTAFFFGDLIAAHEHADAGLALYRKDTHRQHALVYGGHDPAVCGYILDAFTLQILGYPDRALKQLDQGLKLARELEHAPSLVHGLWFAAELYYLRRDTRMTISTVETWLAIASGYTSTAGAANMMILRGWSQIISEDFKTGLPLLRDGTSRLRGTGSKFQIAYRLGRAVEALRKAGETEEAVALLSECSEANTMLGERWYEAELHRLKGELLLIHNDSSADEVAHCFRAAIEVARAQSARSWELRATTSLARLLDSQGRRDEARTMLAEIYGWFTEGFDTADLKDAKSLLAQLGT
jgi:predicted ATPase